ncbi:MAG: class II aldolase/adducin family protein [Candidatus Saganbacteria bacterium]|nr:class II aldolase/adducin family protein [Candidatus Saganbacteria bacterium]
MFKRFESAAKILFQSGLNDSHSGNISSKESDGIFITSRFAIPALLKEQDIILVDSEKSGDNDALASRDLPIHRAIYQSSTAKAVIHAHLPSALALSITENKILPQDTKGQALFPQGLSILKPRQGAEKEELIRMIIPVLGPVPGAVVIKGYGVFAYGNSIEEALEIITALEMSSKVWLSTKLIPQKISQGQSMGHNQGQRTFEHRKRTAIPPGIGVMDRRSGISSYRRDKNR